ncbi:MAG: pyrroline-5-carboxylate reductase [Defluviitaleaceae bacterium]|nr:pyrroline-5-carboxylate reductase [Defluviitaleaceae bacterium]
MKLGFIGAGNMAGAIIGGIVNSGLCQPKDIIASALRNHRLLALKEQYSILTTQDNEEVIKKSDIVFLCVKPQVIDTVISQIKNTAANDKIIVSVAAGKTLEQLYSIFEVPEAKIIRAMPNTPSAVGCGMTAICHRPNIQPHDLDNVRKIFESIGKVAVLPEELFHAFIGIAGSSPAYVFMFIEAMADAGVSHGLSRSDALIFASQAVLGAAQMVINAGIHPAVLKDNVASPNGTTIEAICELEARGFRNAVISAVDACVQKSKKMSKDE